MGCFDLAHSQHLQAWLVPAPLAILAQHPPWGGWDTAAKASLDVPLPTWGRVCPGRAPGCSRKAPAHSVAATREPKPWRKCPGPAVGQGGASTGLMVPSCFSSPRPEDKVDFGVWIPLLYSRLLFTPAFPLHLLSPLESLVCPRQAPVPPPLGQRGVQHPAPLFPKPQNLLLPWGPQGLCVTFTGCWGRELSHGASQQKAAVQADRTLGGMRTPCLPLVSPAARWMAGHESLHQRGKRSPGSWAAGCSGEEQMCISCPQTALVPELPGQASPS